MVVEQCVSYSNVIAAECGSKGSGSKGASGIASRCSFGVREMVASAGSHFGSSTPPVSNPPMGYCKAMATPMGKESKLEKEQQEIHLVDKDESSFNLLNEQGTLLSWTHDHPSPNPVPSFEDDFRTEKVVCGNFVSYALRDNCLWSWAATDMPALGRESTQQPPTVPAQVDLDLPAGDRIVKVCAGESHCAVISDAGDVYLWGVFNDSRGDVLEQTHPEAASAEESPFLANVPKPHLKSPLRLDLGTYLAVDIASGKNHSIVILQKQGDISKQMLLVIGSNEFGQLFMGEKSTKFHYRVHSTDELQFMKACSGGGYKNVELNGVRVLRAYAGGYTSFLKIDVGGSAGIVGGGKCDNGQVGCGVADHRGVHRPTLIQLPALCSIEDISGADDFTMGLASDGSVWVWGQQRLCGLGSESVDPLCIPKPIPCLRNKIRSIWCVDNAAYVCSHEGFLLEWGECDGTFIDCPRLVDRRLFKDLLVKEISRGTSMCLSLCVRRPSLTGLKRHLAHDELPSVMKKTRLRLDEELPDDIFIGDDYSVPRFGRRTSALDSEDVGYCEFVNANISTDGRVSFFQAPGANSTYAYIASNPRGCAETAAGTQLSPDGKLPSSDEAQLGDSGQASALSGASADSAEDSSLTTPLGTPQTVPVVSMAGGGRGAPSVVQVADPREREDKSQSVADDCSSASDAGGQASDAGGQASDAGSQASDAGSQASDAGSQASDAGSQASDAGGQASDVCEDDGPQIVTEDEENCADQKHTVSRPLKRRDHDEPTREFVDDFAQLNTGQELDNIETQARSSTIVVCSPPPAEREIDQPAPTGMRPRTRARYVEAKVARFAESVKKSSVKCASPAASPGVPQKPPRRAGKRALPQNAESVLSMSDTEGGRDESKQRLRAPKPKHGKRSTTKAEEAEPKPAAKSKAASTAKRPRQGKKADDPLKGPADGPENSRPAKMNQASDPGSKTRSKTSDSKGKIVKAKAKAKTRAKMK